MFIYGSSRGVIKMADMRQAALCDQHAKRALVWERESRGCRGRQGRRAEKKGERETQHVVPMNPRTLSWALLSLSFFLFCLTWLTASHPFVFLTRFLAPPPLLLLLLFSTEFEVEVDEAHRGFFSEILSSIADVKFSPDGRYIMSRDYLTVKV